MTINFALSFEKRLWDFSFLALTSRKTPITDQFEIQIMQRIKGMVSYEKKHTDTHPHLYVCQNIFEEFC